MKKLLAITIAAALLLAGCASAAIDRVGSDPAPAEQMTEAPVQEEQPSEAAVPEEPAPTTAVADSDGTFEAFTTVDTNGNSVSESLLSGSKLTVVSLWATYCQPCIMELPALQKLSDEYAGSGVQVIGLVRDVTDMDGNAYDDQVKLANDITSELDVTFPQIIPTKELNYNALSGYMYTPTTIFLGSGGQLVGEPIVGYVEYETLAQTVDSLLADIDAQAQNDDCPTCS